MTTMLERAARALVAELCLQDTGRVIPPEQVGFTEGLEIDYIDQTSVDVGALVRAVLQAIREPDEAMIEQGRPEIVGYDPEWDDARERAGDVWQAMIDTILSDRMKGDQDDE